MLAQGTESVKLQSHLDRIGAVNILYFVNMEMMIFIWLMPRMLTSTTSVVQQHAHDGKQKDGNCSLPIVLSSSKK